MNKARDDWDAAIAAHEVELAAARERFAAAVRDPATRPTSELLGMFVGLTVGGALGTPAVIPGTQIERDHALGCIAIELDRRIPVPR